MIECEYMQPYPPFIDMPIAWTTRRTKCEFCGIRQCDSCRIFGERKTSNESVLKTHKWKAYGLKTVEIDGVKVKRRYYKCKRCTSFGLPRSMMEDTYPDGRIHRHSLNGSMLAPCSTL